MQLTRFNTFVSDAGMLKLIGFCLLVLACVASCNSLQCYVCGGNGEQNCDDYNSSNQHLFIKDCPPGSKSCSNNTNADSVVLARTCESNLAGGCQIFKEFQFCYCYGNLCNGISSIKQSFPNDDEDIDDGSGMDERKLNPTSPTPTKVKVSSFSILLKCNPILVIIISIAFSI